MFALLLAAAICAEPDSRPAAKQPALLMNHPFNIAMLKKNNEIRARHGLYPHKLNEKLCQAAQRYAVHCARTGCEGHDCDGGWPKDRVTRAGYSWSAVGENWAGEFPGYRYPDPSSAFDRGWMKSDGHRALLLSREHTEVGFGVARGSNGYIFCYDAIYAKP